MAKSSKIKLPVVGSVSYLAAALGAAAIYYLWSGSGGRAIFGPTNFRGTGPANQGSL